MICSFPSISSQDCGIDVLLLNWAKERASITISNNILKSFPHGISVFNHTILPDNVFISHNNILVSDSMNASSGLILKNPINIWKINDNTIQYISEGIRLEYTSNSNIVPGISFSQGVTNSNNILNKIEHVILNETDSVILNKTDSVYSATNFQSQYNSPFAHTYSFHVVNDGIASSNGIDIVGYSLPSQVAIEGADTKTTVRNNFISSNVTDLPITLLNDGNNNIPKPTNLSTQLNDNNDVILSYELSGLDTLNADFKVDIYESNSDGDLLSLLATDIRQDNGTYSRNLGKNYVDRLGVTVTSDNHNDYPLGTSEVGYIKCAPPPTVELHCPGSDVCAGETVNFQLSSDRLDCDNLAPTWVINKNELPSHSCDLDYAFYLPDGYSTFDYTITVYYNNEYGNRESQTCTVTVIDCFCTGGFAPEPGKEYVLSAWVTEENYLGKINFDKPQIELNFYGENSTSQTFTGSGQIIDGWQKIEENFYVPPNTQSININLKNTSTTENVYFDDIRIFPTDGTIKTYVFDPLTGRLAAILDENNYATYYEYDEEGHLVRTKKETERGVMTIQENRSNTKKEP